MRLLLGLSIALAAFGQDTSSSSLSSVDINGRRVNDGVQIHRTKSADGSSTEERTQSINGRNVTLEKVEEHILRNDASGRVVERITRRFDPSGNPAGMVKQTIEEQKHPDGSTSTQSTSYQRDINGGMRLTEKIETQSHKSDSGETAETVIQRPLPDGSIGTVERRSKVVVKDANGYREDTTTYRRDGNGGFSAAVRSTKEHSETGGQSSDNTAEYEPGPDGRLQLHSQTVAHTVTRPDGSTDSVIDIFGTHVPGVANDTSRLKLQEQQIVQTKAGPSDTTVETLSVRRPTVSDPNSLGPARQVSETVCKGNCKP